jgi:hypothetical protein
MHPKPMQALAPLQVPALSQQTPTLTTRGGYKVTTPFGTDDLVVYFNNNEVLRITLGGDMTIKTKGTLRLEAADIDLKCTGRLTVNAGHSLDLKSGLDASLLAHGSLVLKAGYDVNMWGGRDVTLRGTTISLD